MTEGLDFGLPRKHGIQRNSRKPSISFFPDFVDARYGCAKASGNRLLHRPRCEGHAPPLAGSFASSTPGFHPDASARRSARQFRVPDTPPTHEVCSPTTQHPRLWHRCHAGIARQTTGVTTRKLRGLVERGRRRAREAIRAVRRSEWLCVE